MGRDTFNYPRLLQAWAKLALVLAHSWKPPHIWGLAVARQEILFSGTEVAQQD